jgi:hypothetical protein
MMIQGRIQDFKVGGGGGGVGVQFFYTFLTNNSDYNLFVMN